MNKDTVTVKNNAGPKVINGETGREYYREFKRYRST